MSKWISFLIFFLDVSSSSSSFFSFCKCVSVVTHYSAQYYWYRSYTVTKVIRSIALRHVKMKEKKKKPEWTGTKRTEWMWFFEGEKTKLITQPIAKQINYVKSVGLVWKVCCVFSSSFFMKIEILFHRSCLLLQKKKT